MANTFLGDDESQDEEAYMNAPGPDYMGEIIDEPDIFKSLLFEGEEHIHFTTRAPYSMIQTGKALLISETGE